MYLDSNCFLISYPIIFSFHTLAAQAANSKRTENSNSVKSGIAGKTKAGMLEGNELPEKNKGLRQISGYWKYNKEKALKENKLEAGVRILRIYNALHKIQAQGSSTRCSGLSMIVFLLLCCFCLLLFHCFHPSFLQLILTSSSPTVTLYLFSSSFVRFSHHKFCTWDWIS